MKSLTRVDTGEPAGHGEEGAVDGFGVIRRDLFDDFLNFPASSFGEVELAGVEGHGIFGDGAERCFGKRRGIKQREQADLWAIDTDERLLGPLFLVEPRRRRRAA